MAHDYLTVLDDSLRRADAALAAAPTAVIPWSEAWTVAECARHVGAVGRWMAAVIDGRPTAGWEARASFEEPDLDSPDLGAWVHESSAALLDRLSTIDAAESCWSWWPEDQTVGFWRRRAAHETLVHRWDLELGAGIAGPPMAPAIAADGIDEYLDVFVGVGRLLHSAPGAGETIHVHCTDTDGEWLLALPEAGARELRREHAKGDVALRGPAEGLLLHLWGRLDAPAAGVEVLGDESVVARQRELLPPM